MCASTLDALATEIRHLARTEVREVQEPFAEGQKGSSAMPHKRNPVVSERVTGSPAWSAATPCRAGGCRALARARHLHSSAERLIMPDATGLLAFMLRDLTWVVDGLVVFPEPDARTGGLARRDRLQPDRPARAGGRGAVARRGLPDRATSGGGRVGP